MVLVENLCGEDKMRSKKKHKITKKKAKTSDHNG